MITALDNSFKSYRSSLGRLGALVKAWLLAMNSYDDGVFSCMLTVHPLNVALLKRPGVLQSWFECKFVSCLLADGEQLSIT